MEREFVPYKIANAGFADDIRERNEQRMSKDREDVLDSMLNIILNHKKELQKVPQCSTLEGARAWADKRPGMGYRARKENIGGDGEDEIVVYDKAGRPFMVNGYKLKPSDFGMRHEYWTENNTSEKRAGNPMRAWARKKVWHAQESDHSAWDFKVDADPVHYDRFKKWGYRMPTKPKTQIAPYAIFSKLIAPMVSDMVDGDGEVYSGLYLRIAGKLGEEQGQHGEKNGKFMMKIVSPISIYRYLWMRLVEQKYFFSLRRSPATTRQVQSYKQYKDYVKRHPAELREWFMRVVLDGPKKDKFMSGWVNPAAIVDNMIKGEADLDGSDLQDGLVFLLSPVNLQDAEPVTWSDTKTKDEVSATFGELIVNNDAADSFLRAVNSKAKGTAKLKKRLEKWKRNAQRSMDSYFKDPKVIQQFFESDQAWEAFLAGVEQQLPNTTTEEGLEMQKTIASPAKEHPVVSENQMEPTSINHPGMALGQKFVIPDAEEEDGDDDGQMATVQRKGQTRMEDYFPAEQD